LKKGLVVEKSNVKGLGTIFYYFGHSATAENVGERGVSHLAEHLLCKSFDHLLSTITTYSVSYNAFTSDDHVCFYWSGLDDKLTELEPEFKKLFNFVPTKEQFELEKSIIIQEYTGWFAGQSAIYANINRKYYDYYGPIGCRQDIESISYEHFLEFYKRFSSPTIIYRVTGNKKSEIKELYKGIKFSNPVKLKKKKASKLVIEETSSFPNSVTLIDWVDVSKFEKHEIEFVSSMFSNGLESPLYKEIRENRGLVYGLGTYTEDFGDVNKFEFVAQCVPENVAEVRSVANEILTNPEKYLTRERFESIKMSSVNNEKLKNIQNQGTGSILNKIIYGKDYFEKIQNLTFERVMEVANLLKVELETNVKHASLGETQEI